MHKHRYFTTSQPPWLVVTHRTAEIVCNHTTLVSLLQLRAAEKQPGGRGQHDRPFETGVQDCALRQVRGDPDDVQAALSRKPTGEPGDSLNGCFLIGQVKAVSGSRQQGSCDWLVRRVAWGGVRQVGFGDSPREHDCTPDS